MLTLIGDKLRQLDQALSSGAVNARADDHIRCNLVYKNIIQASLAGILLIEKT
jgi:hypothetical protein